jgi:formyl-CoA transferase
VESNSTGRPSECWPQTTPGFEAFLSNLAALLWQIRLGKLASSLTNDKELAMDLPLKGIKVIDFTGVQAGPACTQLMAWLGADVLKVERPGVGDVTRNQLRDIPDLDALYFTQLNGNKRSLAVNTKTPEGKAILEQLIRQADVLVENFAPGAMDRMGFTWKHIQELNPRIIFGSVKGFGEGSPYADLKVYENIAQCAGGAASTTGFWDGPPTVSGAALGDSNTGMHLLIGILAALLGREKTGKGQMVTMSMQDAVLNLCRVKLRDQERLEHVGYLEEYPQYPNGKFGDAVPRGGNAGGGGQPGWVLKCKGWETDPNEYIYFTIQEQNWERTCQAIGKPQWVKDPAFATARARQSHIFQIFAEIEKWLADKTKFQAIDILRKFEVPCGPVLSMKEIAYDPYLRSCGSIVEVPQEERGNFLTVGCPMKFSDFKPQITGAPLLGEHTDQVLRELGYNAAQIAELHRKKVVDASGLDRHHHNIEQLRHGAANGANVSAFRKEPAAGKVSVAKS